MRTIGFTQMKDCTREDYFCEWWDETSFGPGYPTETLEQFTPKLRAVFARTPYDPQVLQPGLVCGLPAVTG